MIALFAALQLLLAVTDVPAHEPWIERGLPLRESSGQTTAISPRGARGLWQVMPVAACARLGLGGEQRTGRARAAFCRAAGEAIAPVWHVPQLGARAGRAVLHRYLVRCEARGQGADCALRCYLCGNAGFDPRRCKAGDNYARDVALLGGR